MGRTATGRPSGGGLEGVIVADTALSEIDGRAGRLVYRGYDAAALVAHAPFEAIWHLLWRGDVPDAQALDAFRTELRAAGALTPAEEDIVRAFRGDDTVVALRSAVSALGASRALSPWLYRDPAAVQAEVMGLAAAVPRLVLLLATDDPAGSWPVGDGYAAAYLASLPGVRTDPAAVAALDRYLALTAEHGFNASTFAVRVVASTGADVGAALVAGIGAFSGPLHGGAPSGVLEMLDQIGVADRAADWMEREIQSGRRIMGFGHRVYRTEDPRARSLKAIALALGGGRPELALAVEAAAADALRRLKPGRELHPNVEFWAAVVLEQCGIPRSLFTATFACSRVVGWSAHLLEQIASNRIFRPAARYVGPQPEETPASVA